MSHELMITNYNNRICACFYEEGRLAELQVIPEEECSDFEKNEKLPMDENDRIVVIKEKRDRLQIGDIYVGRVQNIVKNLDAASVIQLSTNHIEF